MGDLESRFPDLLRRVAVDPRQVPHDEWLKGVEAIAESLSVQGAVPWLRLACRRERDAKAELVSEMRKHDSAFPDENADELHSLLAGAVLERALDYSDPAAQAIALAVHVSRFSNWEPALAELVPAAYKRLRELQVESRDQAVDQAQDADLAPIDQAAASAAQIATVGPTIAAGLTTIKNVLETVRTLKTEVKSLKEELDIAWWLLGESLTSGEAFRSVEPTALAASIALELKQLTRFDLPPSSAEAILARILEIAHAQPKKASIRQFVNAVSRSSRTALVSPAKLTDDLTPLILSCATSATVDDSDIWVGIARGKLPIDFDAEVSLRDLSLQLYEELCLLKLLENGVVRERDAASG
jgi:hypothetical protein